MSVKLCVRLLIVLLCVTLVLAPAPARADTLKTDAELIIVGIVLISAALAVGIYYVASRPPTLTGCAASGSGGLSVVNEGNQEMYQLIGDTANIKPGDRIKVSGKRKKKDAAGARTFLVEKLRKDYGPCKVMPATP